VILAGDNLPDDGSTKAIRAALNCHVDLVRPLGMQRLFLSLLRLDFGSILGVLACLVAVQLLNCGLATLYLHDRN